MRDFSLRDFDLRGLVFVAIGLALPSAARATDAVAVELFTVSANDTTSAYARYCPSGSSITGGGFDSESVNALSAVASGPAFNPGDPSFTGQPLGRHGAPEAWYTDLLNTGQADHAGAAAAMCRSKGRTIDIENLAVDAGTEGAQRILCLPGEVATGGAASGGTATTLRNSAPLFDNGTANGERLLNEPDGTLGAPIGWRSTARNDDTTSWALRAGAICDAHVARVVTVIESVTVPAGGRASQRAFCTSGRPAIGGGVDVVDAADVGLLSSAPIFDDGTANGQRLLDRTGGTNPAAIGWYGAAHSADASDRTLKVAVLCPEAARVEAECAAVLALVALRRRRD